MSASKGAGFTIIETILVLTISSALLVALLIGTGSSINNQRYRDSINSLQSYLQSQYSEVTNVRNSNTSNNCNGEDKPRGSSDCVILGRYITSDGGTVLDVQTVVGRIPTSVSSSDDVGVIKEYMTPYFKLDSLETYDVEWGATIVNRVADGGTDMRFSLLILKSPNSGVVHTFVDKTSVISKNQIVNKLIDDPAPINTDAIFCLDSKGLSSQPKTGVVINRNASGPGGIQFADDNRGC